MLLQQYEYEEAAVRGGQQLLHSPFLQVLIALACDLRFDRFDNYIPAHLAITGKHLVCFSPV